MYHTYTLQNFETWNFEKVSSQTNFQTSWESFTSRPGGRVLPPSSTCGSYLCLCILYQEMKCIRALGIEMKQEEVVSTFYEVAGHQIAWHQFSDVFHAFYMILSEIRQHQNARTRSTMFWKRSTFNRVLWVRTIDLRNESAVNMYSHYMRIAFSAS